MTQQRQEQEANWHAHPKAFALRPMRINERKDIFVYYEATTFPKNPRAGCDMYLRRVELMGGFAENGEGPRGIDVLDEDGSILQTFTVSRRGFEYLRRTLKFRREVD